MASINYASIKLQIKYSLSLFLKTSLGAHPFIRKWDFIQMQIKFMFIWMVGHQASPW